jgi:hypothetical protein
MTPIIRTYNSKYAELCTERGSLLLTAEQLKALADDPGTLRISAHRLRTLQASAEPTLTDNSPPTLRDGHSSAPPRGDDDVLRGML